MLLPIPSTKIVSIHPVECQYTICSFLSLLFIILILLTPKLDTSNLLQLVLLNLGSFPNTPTPTGPGHWDYSVYMFFFIRPMLFSKGSSVLFFAVKFVFLKGILCRTPLHTRDNHEASLIEDGLKGAQSP